MKWFLLAIVFVSTATFAGERHHDHGHDYPEATNIINQYFQGGARYGAMAGIQMDINVDSLQVAAAFTYDKDDKGMEQDGYAASLGQRFCFDDDNCGFFGINVGKDDFGETYTVTTTWTIK